MAATQWEVVIGLETHAQLSTASKIFSGASTQFGADANTQACPVDLALPGVLPVMNRGAVERAIRFGLAIGATVAPRSIFARKNYFYPDLPKGYQISQYEIPVVQGGQITIQVPANEKTGKEAYEKTVNLTRAHLEEDAGINYSLEEYANAVAFTIKEVCDEADVPVPDWHKVAMDGDPVANAVAALRDVLADPVRAWSEQAAYRQHIAEQPTQFRQEVAVLVRRLSSSEGSGPG